VTHRLLRTMRERGGVRLPALIKCPAALYSSVKWTVVVEYDPESRHYVATVPGLDIVADARSEKAAVRLAREAIPLHLEALKERGQKPVPRAKFLEVEV